MRDAGIACARRATVCLPDVVDAISPLLQYGEECVLVLGPIVDDHDFEVGKGLRENGPQRVPDEVRRVEHGDDDADVRHRG